MPSIEFVADQNGARATRLVGYTVQEQLRAAHVLEQLAPHLQGLAEEARRAFRVTKARPGPETNGRRARRAPLVRALPAPAPTEPA
jgi:hypothetical protein